MNYSDAGLSYFRQTRHVGTLAATPGCFSVSRGEAGLGRVLELSICLSEQHITQARFRAYGSPTLIAAAEWLCAWLEGRDTLQALEFNHRQLLAALALPATALADAVLAEQTLQALLHSVPAA